MKLTGVEKKEKSTVELSILVEKEEFEAACEKAYRQNVGKINIQGFRKGKAPRKIIEKLYGASFFHEDAVNICYPDAYDTAVAEAKLEPVGRPALTDFDISDGAFSFKAIVPVKPEMTIKDYVGIKAEKEEAVVTDAEVDAEVDRFAERNARLVTVERPVQNGDTVLLDFEGFTDGVAFEGGKGENFSLKIGSGSFIPGFEDQIVGKEAGQPFDVNVTFPEQYGAANLAGKPAVFKCRVNEIKESIKPELDDEFAKDVSDFDTFDEFKADLRAKQLEARTKQVNAAFDEAVMGKLIEGLEGEIPDAMFDAQTDRMVEDFAYRMSMQGISLDMYLQANQMDPQVFRQMFREPAERQTKIMLALECVAKAEGFAIEDEQLDAEYTKLAEQNNMTPDRVRELLSAKDLTHDLLMQKASEFVVSGAKAVKPAKKSASPEKAEKAKKPEKKTEKPKAEASSDATKDAPAKKTARKKKPEAEQKEE